MCGRCRRGERKCRSCRCRRPAFGAETLRQPVGEDDAAIGDAEQEQAGGLAVPADNGGNDGANGLVDRFGVVLRWCGHEPKVLRGGVGASSAKAKTPLIRGRKLYLLMAGAAVFYASMSRGSDFRPVRLVRELVTAGQSRSYAVGSNGWRLIRLGPPLRSKDDGRHALERPRCSRSLRFPPSDRVPDEFCRILEFKLFLDVAAMHINGFGAEVQLRGDITCAFALSDKLEDLKLAVA